MSSILHARSDHSTNASFDLTRDERGSPTRITDADGNHRDFGYDALNRLTSETWRDSGESMTDQKLYYYDGAYNRTALAQDGEATIYYEYDARNALVAEAPVGGTPTYMTYNEAGSVLTEVEGEEQTDYTWTADEMLARVDLPSGLSNYFTYDGDQRRHITATVTCLRAIPSSDQERGDAGTALPWQDREAGLTGGSLLSGDTIPISLGRPGIASPDNARASEVPPRGPRLSCSSAASRDQLRSRRRRPSFLSRSSGRLCE